VAVTVKVAVPPTVVVCEAGCLVMTGLAGGVAAPTIIAKARETTSVPSGAVRMAV